MSVWRFAPEPVNRCHYIDTLLYNLTFITVPNQLQYMPASLNTHWHTIDCVSMVHLNLKLQQSPVSEQEDGSSKSLCQDGSQAGGEDGFSSRAITVCFLNKFLLEFEHVLELLLQFLLLCNGRQSFFQRLNLETRWRKKKDHCLLFLSSCRFLFVLFEKKVDFQFCFFYHAAAAHTGGSQPLANSCKSWFNVAVHSFT